MNYLCIVKPKPIALTAFMTWIMIVLPAVCVAASDGLGYTKERPLIVGLDADYAPLEYVGDDGLPQGYDVEFTKILMKRLGLPFTYAPNTWEKIAGDVLHGRVDLGMMIYSDYRKDITNYSRAVFRLYYQLVFRKQDEEIFDLRNLQGKRIAYMKSRPVGEMLTREGAIKEEVVNMEKAMNDLNEGKYDALVCFRYQARYFIVHHQFDNLMAEELSLPPREYCYVSHSRQLIDVINAELKLMEHEGIIDDVYGKEIKSQFGSIEIPQWVWFVLGSLVLALLLVTGIIRYISARRLAVEHEKLLKAYDLLAEKNEALTVANARAEESSRMKSSFIKQISHEIRTPLNILSGFTQVMAEHGPSLDVAARVDISQRITENTERITGLVNKMLELSDASSMAVIERSDNITASKVVEQAVVESTVDKAVHVRLVRQIPEELASAMLNTNARMAVRALALLLDNAQKFTKTGTVTLRLKPASVGQMAFVVEDTGIGIPVEEAEHVFDEFVQLDEYYDGTGIGLTVARSIARRLGGDIVLDTSYTEGSRFVFTLPASLQEVVGYEKTADEENTRP